MSNERITNGFEDCESTKCVAIWYHEIQKIQEIIQQDEGKNIQKRSGSPVRPDTGGQPSGDQPVVHPHVGFLCLYGGGYSQGVLFKCKK